MIGHKKGRENKLYEWIERKALEPKKKSILLNMGNLRLPFKSCCIFVKKEG